MVDWPSSSSEWCITVVPSTRRQEVEAAADNYLKGYA
jgi:hypothetical protein